MNKNMVLLGMAFIVLDIILAYSYSDPPATIYTLYKLIAALGAAGISSGFTGFFSIELSNKIKAGGALAIFACVFYIFPPTSNNVHPKVITTNDCQIIKPNETQCQFNVEGSTIYPISKGDTVEIVRLSGRISLGLIVGDSGPDGIDKGMFGISLTRYCISNQIRHGALMYKEANEDWRLVKEGDIIIANQKGVIQFDVNDREKENNEGFYSVLLKCRCIP
jgi:hypothetical protein